MAKHKKGGKGTTQNNPTPEPGKSYADAAAEPPSTSEANGPAPPEHQPGAKAPPPAVVLKPDPAVAKELAAKKEELAETKSELSDKDTALAQKDAELANLAAKEGQAQKAAEQKVAGVQAGAADQSARLRSDLDDLNEQVGRLQQELFTTGLDLGEQRRLAQRNATIATVCGVAAAVGFGLAAITAARCNSGSRK